jgi:EAL domain-containing protein (putative c-di-GMP-specific phosphodiesterase class I)
MRRPAEAEPAQPFAPQGTDNDVLDLAAVIEEYTFAYQPIVDIERKVVASFEALVRGPENESAMWVLSQLDRDELLAFDSEARRRALRLATDLGLTCHINLNMLPDGIQRSMDALDATIAMADECGLTPDRLVLEVSETETIDKYDVFVDRVNRWRAIGVKFAIDDFGSGYSGLNLLAEFQPEAIKLDMALVRDIAHKGPRQAVIRGVIRTCEDLGIDIVAEGVETIAEAEWLHNEGIVLFQGYLFAKPGFRHLPDVNFPLF